MGKHISSQKELIGYSLSFFDEIIKGIDRIKLDDIENLEHNLINLKNKVKRSYDFINHYNKMI